MYFVVIIGFLLCLGAMLFARILSERAWRHLSSEEKLALFDGFSNVRLWDAISTLCVILLFLPLLYFYSNRQLVWGGSLLILAALRTVFLHFYRQRRFRELATPETFIVASQRTEIIKAVGWAIFFGTLLAWFAANP